MKSLLKRLLYLIVGITSRFSDALAKPSAFQDDGVLENELKFLAAERQIVVTPSKLQEHIAKTVAATTVITQEQMRAMGARNLLDVLRLVPGLGVVQTGLGIREIEVRGIGTYFSEKVLFLLNGHPLDHNLLFAGSTAVYDDLPVDTIRRIEVVRGPGSALYGANAFLAVINIITPGAREIEGVQASAGWGSFDTGQYRLSYGRTFGAGTEAAVHFNFTDTNGHDAPIAADTLSLRGLPSLAPGTSHLTERRHDLEWRLGYRNFKLDGRFIHKRMGTFAGGNLMVSDRSHQDYDDYFLRLSHRLDILDNLTVDTQVYRDFFSPVYFLQLRPSVFDRSTLKAVRTGTELQGTYRPNPNNTLIGGFSYAEEEQSDVARKSGFDPERLQPAPPSSANFRRRRWGLYAQDIWDAEENLRFALGMRYDEYSDFGGTFNPRLGLNWEFVKHYSFKFAYGTAYRAPAFGELSIANNRAITGNAHLEPEAIETFETGLVAYPVKGLSIQATLYRNHIGKLIRIVPAPDSGFRYENEGTIDAEGIELEGRYDVDPDAQGSYLAVNYAYQQPTRQGRRLPDVPRQRANLMLNWVFDAHWSGFAHVLLKGGTGRAPGDTRPDVPGYAVANLSLLNRNLLGRGTDIGFTVYNLFDKRYVDPAPAGIPGDFPAAGRAYFGHVTVRF
jgi:outer membrane cobalamin receptor